MKGNVSKVKGAAGQSSTVDESKLIPKTVSGSFISVDDVSEIPHNVECKVESVNLCPEEVYSGYYLDANGVTQGANAGFLRLAPLKVEPSTAYTFSTNLKIYTAWFFNEDGGIERVGLLSNRAEYSFTTPDNCTELRITLHNTSGAADTTAFEYAMLNRGTEALPYTPYVEPESVSVTKHGVDASEGYQTLTPNVDGTVEGMTSVSPYMDIFIDTEGVNIEATYNKSWGMQTEYDRFWDSYQSNGEKTAYNYAFSYAHWNDETYKPKYKPTPVNASYMFTNTRITDTKIDVDFSNATNMNYCFLGAYYVKHIGTVDTRKAKNSITQLFAYCRALKTIDKLILLDDGSQTFSSFFLENNALQNIVIEGVIGNSISFQYSPLSKESITSVVNSLSSTASGKTATFKLSAVNTAFETAPGVADGSTSEEFAALAATKTNWTITMV